MRRTANTTETAIDYHDSIAQAFDDRYTVSAGFQQRFRVWIDLFSRYVPANSQVLDLGCGSGVLSSYLGNVGCSVIGIDGSANMIALCKSNLQSANVHYVLQTLPLSDSAAYLPCDIVIASSVLEYIVDMPTVLQQAYSLLQPGGLFIVSMPNRLSLWRRVERLIYALTGKPTYFGHIRNVSDVETFSQQLDKIGFDTLDTRFFSSFDPISRWLKYLLPEPLVNNLFVGVYCKR